MKTQERFNSTIPPGEHTDFITPADKFFVVYHLGLPETDAAAWSLSIDGLVERPKILTLADLARLPSVELCAVHECAGSPLRPTVPVRRVANVVWTGVRLRTVLDMVGAQPAARFVWSQGADSGIYPPTGVHVEGYLKDMRLDAVDEANVLLATGANGAPLSLEHGGPLRLVVPGHYGTNSVKWLTGIRLEGERAPGYFTTALYNDRIMSGEGTEELRPVWRIAPNSIIVAPDGDTVRVGQPVQVWGWAWSARGVGKVEVSVDGGANWSPARVEGSPPAWQRFVFDWLPSAPGTCEIVSRATDRAGIRQPNGDARNEVHRRRVSVRPAPPA